ncbi:MAG: alpha/beta hydrolase family protein [Melioribacteraceae bacterium]
MKIIFAILILLTTSVFAQISRGFVKEGLTVKSEILNKEVRYTIYLPFDYNSSNRFYPIVYLLHGYTDNDMCWLQFGEVNMIVDEAISSREIPPMIIVTPDADVSWYINNFDGTVMWEDFFIKEFIPAIEKEYRVRKEKRYRGIAGLSMGGYGALNFALKYPDMFSSTAPMSAAIYTDEQVKSYTQKRWNDVNGVLFGKNLVGEDRITKHLKMNSALHFLDSLDLEKIRKVRFYFDCGDDDYLSIGNCKLHIKMNALKIKHEFRIRDGKHSWNYWRSGLVDALKFIGKKFH